MLTVIGIIVVYALTILIGAISVNVQGADYLILLGSGLKNDREGFTMIRRVNRAALYLLRNPECRVVVSGGITGNNTVSEAEVMKRLLMERHIREEMIILEDRSVNTKENMRYSKDLINTAGKIIVCSSDYHVLRAKLLASGYGYKCGSIFSQSTLTELLVHLPLEEIFIIKDLIEINRIT